MKNSKPNITQQVVQAEWLLKNIHWNLRLIRLLIGYDHNGKKRYVNVIGVGLSVFVRETNLYFKLIRAYRLMIPNAKGRPK
jgi:hypothetical protein